MSIQLPQEAQAKLAALSDAVRDADALSAAAQVRMEKLSEDADVLTRRRETVASSDPRWRALTDDIARLEGQAQACREKFLRRRARAGNDRSTVVRATEWLRTIPAGVSLDAVSVPTPDVSDFPASITATRDQLDELQKQRRELRGTPLPASDIKEAAAQWVQQTANSVKPQIAGAEKGREFSLRFEQSHAREGVPIGLPTLAWLFPELVTQRLHAHIDETVGDVATLSKTERDRRITELGRLILGLERSEEAMVCEALDRGFDVMRRSRADVRAVLGIDVVQRRAARPTPITKTKPKRSSANGAHVAA